MLGDPTYLRVLTVSAAVKVQIVDVIGVQRHHGHDSVATSVAIQHPDIHSRTSPVLSRSASVKPAQLSIFIQVESRCPTTVSAREAASSGTTATAPVSTHRAEGPSRDRSTDHPVKEMCFCVLECRSSSGVNIKIKLIGQKAREGGCRSPVVHTWDAVSEKPDI